MWNDFDYLDILITKNNRNGDYPHNPGPSELASELDS